MPTRHIEKITYLPMQTFLAEHQGYRFFGRDYGCDEFVIMEVLVEDTYNWFIDPIEDGLLIDLGANIGAFSVVASEKNRVVAFEPESHNLQFLEANKKLNGRNFDIHRVAVGKPGTSSRIDNNNGGSVLGTGPQEVSVVGLDDIITEEVDFLKCDVEGSEYDIFEYASDETLKKIKRFAMEVHADLTDKKTHDAMIERLSKFFNLSEAVYQGRLFGKRK